MTTDRTQAISGNPLSTSDITSLLKQCHINAPNEHDLPADLESIREKLELAFREGAASIRNVVEDATVKVKLDLDGNLNFSLIPERSVTLSAFTLLEKPHLATFVPGHEAAHLVVTLTILSPVIKAELERYVDVDKLSKSLGVASLLNCIEDPRINDWLCNNYPGFLPSKVKAYDEMFAKEGGSLNLPEVREVASRIGREPLFGIFLSEVIRYWHTDSYSAKLPKVVTRALLSTETQRKRAIAALPGDRSGAEIRAKYLKTSSITLKHVYPIFKELVDADLKLEAQAEFAREAFKNDSDGISDDLKKAIKEQIERLKQQLKEKEETLQDKLKRLQERLARGAGPSTENNPEEQEQDGQGQGQGQGQEDDGVIEGESKRISEEIKELLKDLKALEDSELIPVPLDRLSKEELKALEEAFDKLTPGEKRRLESLAKERLEEFEDVITDNLKAKLKKDIPNHKERRLAAKKLEEQQKQEAEHERFKVLRREGLSDYQKAYEDVAPYIVPLYQELRPLFRPTIPEPESGYPTGSRADINIAMQAEIDPRLRLKVMQRLTEPTYRKYRIILAVDGSGSMSRKKAEEALKEAVLLSEVSNMLKVDTGIIQFKGSEATELLALKETLSPEKREDIASRILATGGGTPDFKAISLATKNILAAIKGEKIQGDRNIIIAITDGWSNVPDELSKAITEAESAGLDVIGTGMGPDTLSVSNYYPIGRGGLKLESANPDERFSSYFYSLIRSLFLNPERLERNF